MKIYMQLAGYRSDGVSSDCINRIGDTKVIETTTTKDIIAKANEMMVAAREQQVWRPVILLATGDWRWAPDTRPGWYMGGRWLFGFNPERDAEHLATTMTKQQVIEAAKFACSPEGHKRGSGAMRRLKEAVKGLGVQLGQCPATIEADRNTLDYTAWRPDGHRLLRSTTYDCGNYEARCLRCGLNTLVGKDGRVIETW